MTGATGSLGQAFVRAVLRDPTTERVVCFSRSESRQAEMAAALGEHPALRFFLGDVRDRARLETAMWGCTDVLHAGALKRLDSIAYNPEEVSKTNVVGSANVTAAALAAGVKNVVLVSSDKAAHSSTSYGASKFQMECEGLAFNAISYPRGTRIAATRWGNVIGSTGSVVHLFRRAVAEGRPIPITDPRCTRFWLTLDQAVGVAREALARMEGGELFVPVLPTMRIADLAEAIAPGWPTVTVGLRPGGEKIHESLLTEEECRRAVAVTDGLYVVPPEFHPWRADAPWTGDPFPAEGAYRSDLTGWQLSVEQMRELLKEVP